MDNNDSKYRVADLFGATDCKDALHTLYHYLDGELTQERRQAIKHHLSQCQPCLHAFDFEAELKAVVARSCRDQVPGHLRDKIAKALSEASRDDGGSV